MYRLEFSNVEVMSLTTLVEVVVNEEWPEGANVVFASENVNHFLSNRFNTSLIYTTFSHNYRIDNRILSVYIKRGEYDRANGLTGLWKNLYIRWLAFKNIKSVF